MKSKNYQLLIALLALCTFTNNLFAQGTYVNVHLGYGFGLGSVNFDGFVNETATSNSGSFSSTTEQINVSFGKGLNFGAAFGYMFNKNVGADLGLSYLIGGKTTAKQTYQGSSYSETRETTISAKMLRINPSLVVAAGSEKINPYAKLGVVIGLGSILSENEWEEIDMGGDVSNSTMKVKNNGGLGIGLSSGIGILFNLNEKISLFGECSMINMSYSPKKGEITEYTEDGVDQLPAMTTDEKEWEFVDSLSESSNSNPSTSSPTKILKYHYPFGSVGVNLGMRFSF